MSTIHPELDAILASACGDIGHEAYHYHAAADWCEDRGDPAADGLRRMAERVKRPGFIGRGERLCWVWVTTPHGFRPDAYRVNAEQIRRLPRVGQCFFDNFGRACYDTFAHAVYALACAYAKET